MVLSDGDAPFRVILSAYRPTVGWKNATAHWGIGWSIYVNTVISLNGLLMIWTIINITFISQRRRLVCQLYFLTLNIMVLIFALSRLIFFGLDPYGINGRLPEMIGAILLNLYFPALTSGFCLLYAGLQQCLGRSHLTRCISSTKFIICFVVCCFTLSIATDLIVGLTHSAELVILICQLFYILWGITFFCLFSHTFGLYRVKVNFSRRKRLRSCYLRGHCVRDLAKKHITEIPTCVYVCLISAICFLAVVLLTFFLVLAEFGLLWNSVLTDMCNSYMATWPFFIFHSLLQSSEHLMAITLAVCGTQPVKQLRMRYNTSTTASSGSNDILVEIPSVSATIGESNDSLKDTTQSL